VGISVQIASLSYMGQSYNSLLTTSCDTCIFGLTAVILDFRLPLTSDIIPISAIELAILENMVGAFELSILSCLQAEIHAFPV